MLRTNFIVDTQLRLVFWSINTFLIHFSLFLHFQQKNEKLVEKWLVELSEKEKSLAAEGFLYFFELGGRKVEIAVGENEKEEEKTGEMRETSYKKAFDLFERCKELSYKTEEISMCCFFLGKMYKNGLGVGVNLEKAIENYETSCCLGNDSSAFNLARIFEDLNLMDECVKYLNISIQKENDNALNSLGIIFEFGEKDIPRDLNKSIELYERSSSFGNKYAFFNLARMHHTGIPPTENDKQSIPKDLEKAVHYLLLSNTYQNSNTLLLKILKEEREVEWRPLLHKHWPICENWIHPPCTTTSGVRKQEEELVRISFDEQILLLLLISRFRNLSRFEIMKCVLVKGIALKVIVFLAKAWKSID